MSTTSTVELQFLITRLSILLIIYAVLSAYFPSSYLPSCIFLIGMVSSLYKTSNFKWLINKFVNMELPSERQNIVNAIASLKRYETLALAWNNHKIRNLKRVNWEDQKQAVQLGYLDHLNQTDVAIKHNGELCTAIANDALERYNINEAERRSSLYSQNNNKVIEAITHYTRDWSELGDEELKPLISYIKQNIEKNIALEDRGNTVIVVPGSGLGRVAYELSSMVPEFKAVHSVEFSTLMHLCNEFIYSKASNNQSFQLHPYIHTYSHHVTRENHQRSIDLSLHKTKPSNLTTHLADFRKFQIPDSNSFENIVIVTCFFMDTAQNMFEYFKAIESLIAGPSKQRGIWINIGPLKYGTAPVVEFSLDEIRQLRKLRGWVDLDEPQPYGDQMAGYLTDEKGLWRGYYGLGRWTSIYQPGNQTK